MRATSLVIVLAGGIALHCATTAGAAVNNCTSRAAQATVKKDGRTLQTLRSGQYYAYRHAGGQWTICDGKRKGRSAFGTIGLDVNGQKNTGVRLLSQAGRCLAFELRRSGPASRAIPSAPTVDMRPGKAIGGLIHPIDFTALAAFVRCSPNGRLAGAAGTDHRDDVRAARHPGAA